MSVEMFEAEPEAYGFRQVGYLAAVPEARWTTWSRSARSTSGRVRVRARGRRGGAAASTSTWTWPDWEAPVAALLHERRGGWADPMQTVRHLAEPGARGRRRDRRGRRGDRLRAAASGVRRCDRRRADRLRDARAGARARGRRGWAMLGLARGRRWRETATAARLLEGAGGRVRAARGGAGGARRAASRRWSTSTRPGRCAPTATASVLVDGPWGIYFRIGARGTGDHRRRAAGVRWPSPSLDPYGPDNPEHAAEPEFAEFFTSGLATALGASAAAPATGA